MASRLEVNKQVKTILCRHNIDLTRLNFSYIGSTVNLDGVLVKTGGADLSATQIESLVSDIRRIQGVTAIGSNLLNWCISGGAITKLTGYKDHSTELADDEEWEYEDDEDDDDDEWEYEDDEAS